MNPEVSNRVIVHSTPSLSHEAIVVGTGEEDITVYSPTLMGGFCRCVPKVSSGPGVTQQYPCYEIPA